MQYGGARLAQENHGFLGKIVLFFFTHIYIYIYRYFMQKKYLGPDTNAKKYLGPDTNAPCPYA